MHFMGNILAAELHVNILLGTPKVYVQVMIFRQNMYKVESTTEQFKVVADYFDQLLIHGETMNDVQVEQVNFLETK